MYLFFEEFLPSFQATRAYAGSRRQQLLRRHLQSTKTLMITFPHFIVCIDMHAMFLSRTQAKPQDVCASYSARRTVSAQPVNDFGQDAIATNCCSDHLGALIAIKEFLAFRP